MHRWEKEARDLIKSLQFKALTPQEATLWNYLRMCLDDIEERRQEEIARFEQANGGGHTSIGGGDTYGDGY